MSRLLFFAAIMCSITSMQAQTIVGLKGHFGSTWLYNQNIADAGDILDYKGTYAGGFGVHGIKMLSDQSGIALNIGQSTIKQQTQGTIGDFDYVNQTKMKYTDIGLFYTYLAEGGLFLEVGPQLSLRNEEVEEIIDFKGDDEEKFTFTDPNLGTSTVFGVFGIGGMINLNDEFKMSTSVRFGWGITDLTTELSESEYDDLDYSETSFHTGIAQGEDTEVDPVDQTETRTFDYKSTHPAFATFNLGLYYVFP